MCLLTDFNFVTDFVIFSWILDLQLLDIGLRSFLDNLEAFRAMFDLPHFQRLSAFGQLLSKFEQNRT